MEEGEGFVFGAYGLRLKCYKGFGVGPILHTPSTKRQRER